MRSTAQPSRMIVVRAAKLVEMLHSVADRWRSSKMLWKLKVPIICGAKPCQGRLSNFLVDPDLVMLPGGFY